MKITDRLQKVEEELSSIRSSNLKLFADLTRLMLEINAGTLSPQSADFVARMNIFLKEFTKEGRWLELKQPNQ